MALRIVAMHCLSSILTAQQSKLAFPGRDWEKVRPETEGYSSPKFEALRVWLKTQQTTALHISVHGRTIFEYGDVARATKVASVRKSILAMLYGNYVAQGKVNLNQAVEDLELGDVKAFLPLEKKATLLHLLQARSGIFLPTANQNLSAWLPKRGSHEPGTWYQYQNWDFNAAGSAFQKLTGKSVFTALEEDLALPIGMQDFDPKLQRLNDEMPVSKHPEYAMYLSTRDTARVGLLMIAHGNWNGKQLIPKDWASRITTLVTPPRDLHPVTLGALKSRIGNWGYGLLWWVWDAPNGDEITGPYQGAYSAVGSNGQYITVLPSMDMVFAHKVDFDNDGSRQISPGEYHTILQMVIESGIN